MAAKAKEDKEDGKNGRGGAGDVERVEGKAGVGQKSQPKPRKMFLRNLGMTWI